MDRVKIYLDPDSGKFGVNDVNDLHLIMPIFTSEGVARKYIKEMGWTVDNDDLRVRHNNLMFTIKSKADDFIEECGVMPNYVLLSELDYNTALLSNAIKIGIDGSKECQSIMGMGILVDKNNWRSRILVGLMR